MSTHKHTHKSKPKNLALNSLFIQTDTPPHHNTLLQDLSSYHPQTLTQLNPTNTYIHTHTQYIDTQIYAK